ncbi:hypothetical protein AB0H36_32760 [Kribbella sp. NPDC050820]|uniref:hypothetical protein n=1 Tax=Kribbella sp. NPDC050820 TaxID=3155408 RepID=UPI0033C25F49
MGLLLPSSKLIDLAAGAVLPGGPAAPQCLPMRPVPVLSNRWNRLSTGIESADSPRDLSSGKASIMQTVVELAHLALKWDQTSLEYPDTRQWAHHDVAALADGRIVTGHPDGTSLLVFSPDGRRLGTVSTGTVELHGIANDGPEGDSLWAADPGHKRTPAGPDYDKLQHPGRILNISLSGMAVLGELHQPDLEIYQHKAWSPTAVVRIHSGNGHNGPDTVWVSDGYGQSVLHQFSSDGTYLRTIDGKDSGLAFKTPHAIITRRRSDTTELLVADRSNRRIVVLSADGDFIRAFGADCLTSPSGIAALDDGTILVTELFGSVVAFSEAGDLLGWLGSPLPAEKRRPRWPNQVGALGNTVRPALVAGRFNSPHGICVTGGAVLVTEWVIGGRVVRLAPV